MPLKPAIRYSNILDKRSVGKKKNFQMKYLPKVLKFSRKYQLKKATDELLLSNFKKRCTNRTNKTKPQEALEYRFKESENDFSSSDFNN